jgi:hypothetical protein
MNMLRLVVVALAAAIAGGLLGFGLVAHYLWVGAELIFFSILVLTVRLLLAKHGRLGGPSL